MEQHARQRLKERYKQSFTTAIREGLLRKFKKGECRIYPSTQYSTRAIITAVYKQKLYKFVYDYTYCEIVTFLKV